MSSIPNSADAVANDIRYHKTCWVYAERSIQQGVETDEETPRDNDSIIADIEIVEVVRSNILQNKKVCMNDINKTYNNLVGNSEQEEKNHKKYLKSFIEENIPGVVIYRPPNRRQ